MSRTKLQAKYETAVSWESLESRALLASVGTLLQYDFNGATAWSQMVGTSSAGGSATLTQANVGTIDTAGGTTPSGGLQLTETAPASGAWTSDLNSGALAIANTETNLGKLTLSFTLSASQAQPVKVRLFSYNSATGEPTGALETTILPAATNYNQRFAIDLSTMKASGAGTFNPIASYIALDFQMDSRAGWSAAKPAQLRVDNVNYSKPAYYVKPASSGGSDSANGRTEATAFATPSKAVSVAQAGDIIDVMNGTYAITYTGTGSINFRTGGTPAAWVTLKNYPGQSPLIYNEWWNAILIGRGNSTTPSTAPALGYIEVRGMHVHGNADIAGTTYSSLFNIADPRVNNNGISIDGRYEANRPHDIRFADNLVEYCSASGIGTIEGDHLQIENNVTRYNSWWTRYGTSGISVLGASNFDGTVGNYTRVVTNNVSYGNECYELCIATNSYSDGNGIIIDVNKNTQFSPTSVTTGRTLVQNNLTYGNGGSGIHAFVADHVDIVNNTAYLNSHSPLIQYGEIFAGSSNDVRMFNNVLVAPVANLAAGEKPEPVNSANKSTNVVFNNNIYFGGNTAPIMGTGDVKADPKFVNASANSALADFRLQSTSPAINAGTTTLFPSLDFLGNVRNGTPDIGAYEYYAATPTIVTAASASPSPVTGTSTTLNVVAGDNDGPAGLIYTWAAAAKPAGAADPTFDLNGTNTAKTAIATFTKAGTYTLRVTVTDANALSSTSSVTVVVSPTLSGLSVSPSGATVGTGATQQYLVSGIDQFNQPMASGQVTWSTTGTGNAIDVSGLFTASSTNTGAYTITAVGSGFSAAAGGTVADLTAPVLSGVVSRKVHGSAGTFDLALALGGATKTIEPRINGANTLVFTFSEPVKALDGTLDASEFNLVNATYASAAITGNTLTLTLSSIDQSYESITLSGIGDIAGNGLSGVATLAVGNLYGDVSQSGAVDAVDIARIKAISGADVSLINYLLDLNASGSIDAVDIAIAKSRSGATVS